MTVYKFEHNLHCTDPVKDTYSVEAYSAKEFEGGYVLVDEDGDEIVAIGKASIGELNGTHMYLLTNTPETFLKALIERAQKNLEFHTHHLETLLQRKMRCIQMLDEIRSENDALGNFSDAVEYWRKNTTGISLQDFLGLTDEEYEAWGQMSDEEFQVFLNNRRGDDNNEV
jgi:hypothetical protein